MKPKYFQLPTKLLLTIWLWQSLVPNAVSAQTTTLERRPFIQTLGLELQVTEQKDSIIRLPNGMVNTLYCFSFDLDVPSGTNANQWRIDFMSRAEYYGLFSSTPINYLLPRQDPVLDYQVDNQVLNFRFRPDITGSFNFMLVMTHENGRRIYHPELFKIEVQPYSPLNYEVYLGNTQFNDNKILLQPNENTTLTLKLSNSSGNLSWNVVIHGFQNRLNITEEPPHYSGGVAEYSWTLGYPALTPAQLGHEDTLAFIPLSCNLEPWSPDQPSGGNPIYTLYIQAPSAKVVPQPPRTYAKNQLPGGIAGHEYGEEGVAFELTPNGANFTDYTDWQLINMEDRNRYTSGSLRLDGSRTGPHRLIGVPTEAAYALPVKMVAIKTTTTASDTIASDVFYLTICGHDFDEVPEEYEVVDLGALLPRGVTESNATKMSNSGYIVGSYLKDGKWQNVLWYQDNLLNWKVAELPSQIPKVSNSILQVWDLNDRGILVGGAGAYGPHPNFHQNTNGTYDQYSSLWGISSKNRNSWEVKSIENGLFPFHAINNRGDAIRTTTLDTADNTPVGFIVNKHDNYFKNIANSDSIIVSDINDKNNIVGYNFKKERSTFLLKKPSKKELLPFQPNYQSLHLDIVLERVILNNNDKIASTINGNSILLERLKGKWVKNELTFCRDKMLFSCFASGINDLTQVVGNELNGGFIMETYIYDHRLKNLYVNENEKLNPYLEAKNKWVFSLNDLIKGEIKISQASSINNAGWIAGSGSKGALLLKPRQPYNFITFNQIPVKINNRSQIILKSYKPVVAFPPTNPAQVESYTLWEECLGDITPEAGQDITPEAGQDIYDINDDMLGVGQNKSWQRKGKSGNETWIEHLLPSPEYFIPQNSREKYNTTVKLNGVNNSNEITGQVLYTQKTPNPQDPKSSITRWGGLIWSYPDDRAEEIPKNEQVHLTSHPLNDLNTSGFAITGKQQKGLDTPFGSPLAEEQGVFDIKKDTFYHFETSIYSKDAIKDINDSGIAVGTINIRCESSRTRGFIALPPYTLNTHFREFCDFLPAGINNQGWVVGQQNMKAVVYIPDFPGSLNGNFVDLNTYLSETDRQQWRLIDASGINDKRQVIGTVMKLDQNGATTGVFKGFMLNIDYTK